MKLAGQLDGTAWKLRRSLVPIERLGRFQTMDGCVYRRDERPDGSGTGTIRRAIPKARGKAVRRADRAERRAARLHPPNDSAKTP